MGMRRVNLFIGLGSSIEEVLGPVISPGTKQFDLEPDKFYCVILDEGDMSVAGPFDTHQEAQAARREWAADVGAVMTGGDSEDDTTH